MAESDRRGNKGARRVWIRPRASLFSTMQYKMARAGMILPDEPIVIVDRSLKSHDPSKEKRPSASEAALSPDNLRIFKPSSTGSDEGNTAVDRGQRTPPRRSKSGNPPQTFQFIAASEPGGRQDPENQRQVRRHVRKHVVQNQQLRESARSRGSSRSLEPKQDGSIDVGSQSPPETTSSSTAIPFYNLDNPHVRTAVMDGVCYMIPIVAQTQYPLEVILPFEFNPITRVWLHCALDDKLLLQTIDLISTLHYCQVFCEPEPEHVHPLMRTVLQGLGARVSQQEVSLGTIAAVACLANIENCLGHFEAWNMHAGGVAKMIQLRGPARSPVEASFRARVARADINGAVDNLVKPHLPRTPTSTNLSSNRSPSARFADITLKSGTEQSLLGVFFDMARFTLLATDAIENSTSVDPQAYDELSTEIQHDLLLAQTQSATDAAYRLAGLIYMKTLTRLSPFLRTVSQKLCQALREELAKLVNGPINNELILWTAWMGGMSAVNTDHHSWFLELLKHILRECAYTGWSEVRAKLQDVLWVDAIHDGMGRQLWEAVLHHGSDWVSVSRDSQDLGSRRS